MITAIKKGLTVTSFLFYLLACFHCFAQPSNKGITDKLMLLSGNIKNLERTTTAAAVPDYRIASINRNSKLLQQYKQQLKAIDTVNWPTDQKVNYVLLLAEMNALDFNYRILKPWERDPAFYAIIFSEQSDTPDHEGPTSFAAIEWWQYTLPLSDADAKKLKKQLEVIPPLYAQARINLTGNARDLWAAGIEVMKEQVLLLDSIAAKTSATGENIGDAVAAAKSATISFITWLEQKLPGKTGPSGIGKQDYNWHQRNVLLNPLTWDDEMAILKRELARAYASLQLERERNRGLPELKAFSTPEEFATQTDLAVKKLMGFLNDRKIMPVKDYMEPALRKHIGMFTPEDKRNFFANISFRAPEVLYAHSTHWFEIARLTEEPHSDMLRREALPFNMWMSRSEGLATAMEEILMHAGLWDNNPRARELVWIMLAQRCARGLASLYAQANLISFDEARKFQVKWTPDGWTGDESLVGFEQHLYLRQPGYGTCYVTGKYLIEQLIMDVSRKEGNQFTLFKFFEEFYDVGILPVALIRCR